MSDAVIDIQTVEKMYQGKVHALRGVEMHVHRGQIFGLLGPNGAGKSTLVKILMTVVRPTACRGTLLGRPIGEKGTLARVGYLPEHHRFPGYLTGRQVLDYYGALQKTPRRERKRRIDGSLDLVGMLAWGDKRVGKYSKGMRQRIGVAQTLVGDPELVLLDEPTDGVDPVGRRDIRNVLVRLREEGKTVFLNSHLLSELEMVCDRVAILVKGKVTAQGTIADLTPASGYEVTLEGKPPPWAEGETSVRVEGAGDSLARLFAPGADAGAVQPLIDRLRREERVIVSVRPRRETLEDLFMRTVTDPETGEVSSPGTDLPPRRERNGERIKGDT